jgi:hypothetical protein
MVATLLSVLASGALLVVLGMHDPKRLRNVRQSGDPKTRKPLSAGLRRTLAWLTVVPGAVLGVLGAWWALVVWAGAFGAIGWTVAQLLPGKTSHAVS